MTTTAFSPAFRFHDPESPLAYERLLRAAPRTLRCPVWLTGGALERVDAWVPAPVPPRDPAAVLREWGAPGLARGSAPDREELVREAAAWAREGSWRARLVVGDGRAPAELVAALGWNGAAGVRDPAGLATVLRSWEERFGATVVALGADRMTLSVAAPPGSVAEVRLVAAELRAVCPGEDPAPEDRTWCLRWD